jgi:hypothetical protein
VRELAGLHPNLRPSAEAAVEYAIQQGVRPTVTSVTRTWANQDRLYRNWLACQNEGAAYTGRSLSPGLSCRYPANPPGYSSHQYGFAWDSVVPADYVSWWVAVREAFGWRVPPNDLIHAELPEWAQYADPALLY